MTTIHLTPEEIDLMFMALACYRDQLEAVRRQMVLTIYGADETQFTIIARRIENIEGLIAPHSKR